mmetsp:Transcript_35185/g.71239  ORF Transcript_35185/g.71239 Transcript_35185/m.71239 type:complete len:178 (-) Transcript_35185:1526-2059(-)
MTCREFTIILSSHAASIFVSFTYIQHTPEVYRLPMVSTTVAYTVDRLPSFAFKQCTNTASQAYTYQAIKWHQRPICILRRLRRLLLSRPFLILRFSANCSTAFSSLTNSAHSIKSKRRNDIEIDIDDSTSAELDARELTTGIRLISSLDEEADVAALGGAPEQSSGLAGSKFSCVGG